MVLQFEQKFRSDEQRASSGVPRSLIPLYFLCGISDYESTLFKLDVECWFVLDKVLAFDDLKTFGYPAQIHAAAVSAYFAADAASAELVWDWCLGLEGEFDAATLAASVEFPGGC